MRTNEGRYAGHGTTLAFVEKEETWTDRRVDVRLPNDGVKGKELAALSGPVKVYYIGKEEAK